MKRISFKCMSVKCMLVQNLKAIVLAFVGTAAVITLTTVYAASGATAQSSDAANVQNTAIFDAKDSLKESSKDSSKDTSKDSAKSDAQQSAKSEAKPEDKNKNGNGNSNVNGNSNSDFSALSQLKELLGPISSIQGSFNQKVMNERGKLLRQSQGMMWLKKPGKFRWEVQGKSKHLIVSNGKDVWDFDPELSQVTIQSLPKTKGNTPIYFLTGDISAVSQDFSVEAITADAGKCLNSSDTCFELKPKASSSTFHWIRIGFSENVLKEIEMLDQLGQHSLFSFQKVSTNQSISQKQFQFVPPNGVDIIRN